MFAFLLNGKKIISFVGGVNQKVLDNFTSDFPYKALDEGPHLSTIVLQLNFQVSCNTSKKLILFFFVPNTFVGEVCFSFRICKLGRTHLTLEC